MTNQTDQIRALNDDLRRHLSRTSEMAFMTPGIAALWQRSRRSDRQPVSGRKFPLLTGKGQGILQKSSFASGRD